LSKRVLKRAMRLPSGFVVFEFPTSLQLAYTRTASRTRLSSSGTNGTNRMLTAHAGHQVAGPSWRFTHLHQGHMRFQWRVLCGGNEAQHAESVLTATLHPLNSFQASYFTEKVDQVPGSVNHSSARDRE